MQLAKIARATARCAHSHLSAAHLGSEAIATGLVVPLRLWHATRHRHSNVAASDLVGLDEVGNCEEKNHPRTAPHGPPLRRQGHGGGGLSGNSPRLRLNVTTSISEKRQVFTNQKRCYNTSVHTPRRGVKTVFKQCSHTSYCEYDTCQSPLCLLGSAHGVLRQVYSAARMVCFLRYKPWRSAGRSTCRQRHRLVSRKLILQN